MASLVHASFLWVLVTLALLSISSQLGIRLALANPSSNPYIAYRTSAFQQDGFIDHKLDFSKPDPYRSQIRSHAKFTADATCPLHLSLGFAKRPHSATGPAFFTRQPVVLANVFPATGTGKQVIYTTQYEHLDVLSPARLEKTTSVVKEALTQAADFPLLFESSSFHTSPIIHDINGDGIADAIVTDYDGAIVAIGLASKKGERFLHSTQVPRLYVRREWVEAMVQKETAAPKPDQDSNSTQKTGPDDPFHSYFDFYYSNDNDPTVLKGVTANRLDQDQEHVAALGSRRNQFIVHESSDEAAQEQILDTRHRRLQEEDMPQQQQDITEPENKEQQDKIEPENKEQQEDASAHQQEEIQSGGQTNQQEDSEQLYQNNNEQQPDDNEQQNERHEQKQEKPLAPAPAVENQVNLPPEQQPPKDEQEESSPNEEEHGENMNQQDLTREMNTRQEEQVNHEDSKQQQEPPPVNSQPTVKTPEEIRQEEDRLHRQQIEEGDDRPVIDEKDRLNANGQLFDDALYDEKEADIPNEDTGEGPQEDDYDRGRRGDDYYRGDDYAMDDEYGRGGYDDYYGYDASHEEYYDTKHYMRISPHILADPVLFEIPKPYVANNEVEDILYVPVSYYLDEDEYEGFFNYQRFEDNERGDENEVRRGSYVASALMAYVFSDSNRWSAQHHLDLSTDFTAPENATLVGVLPMQADVTKMGAFALSSPTVADIDGDGKLEVVIGTSMGMVYAFEARNVFKRDKWPVQMPHPVESRILVEDVVGNTDLEVFVADIGGNVVCLNTAAEPVWQRNMGQSLNLAQGSEIQASSPLALGDVDGDGVMDIVTTIRIAGRGFVFAFNAATGQTLESFPIELDLLADQSEVVSNELHEKLPQPLLVDLHADQDLVEDYIRRNGTKWKPRRRRSGKSSNGGSAPGLHIVQPYNDKIYIIEAGSGCTQPVTVGDKVTAMVQADDVHGTNRIDLVVTTHEGKILTMESASPWHALNTWTHGELRGRENAHAHGYSASQGIYVHDRSRQFKNILGVYVPVTFEVFDNRPNIRNEPEKRTYKVEIRDGTSSKRVLWRKEYNEPGVYTERVYIRYGPGYYSLSVLMHTSHGLVYADSFQVQYNIDFMDGFGVLLWLPLLLASAAILLCGSKRGSWDDEEADDARADDNLGILGRALPS